MATGGPNGDPTGESENIGGLITDDAIEVLREVLEWLLPAARWEQVVELVEAAAAAITTRDLAGLRSATLALELASPVRTSRLGTEPTQPSPPPIRERVNYLVHSLENFSNDQNRTTSSHGTPHNTRQPPDR